MKTVRVRHILTVLFLVGVSMNSSCGVEEIIDDLDGGCNENWTTQVKPELDALNVAVSVFQNNPTEENCEKFRVAAVNYVDALEGVEECVLGNQRQSFDTALEQAKMDLTETDCTNL